MGQPFRFVHCGDLHLGAPFRSMSAIGAFGDDRLVEATYKSFENIVDFTIVERVDALLISGDIYNSADHNLEAQVRFVRQLERVTAKGIPVFIVHGNHDPVTAWSAKVPMPEGVHVFASDKVERKSLIVGGREAAGIYGISHATTEIGEDLTQGFQVDRDDDYAIGLLHCTIGGLGSKHNYAPTTVERLRDVGVDYWALGHIHKGQVVATDPYIVYPGNPQGLSRKESGPKGCYLVSVGPTGHTEVTFKPTNAIQWEEATIDITHMQTVEELETYIQQKKKSLYTRVRKPILLHLTLTGSGPLAAACQEAETRQYWLAQAQEAERGKRSTFVLPYALEDATQPPIDLTARRALPDFLGDYLAAYDAVAELPDAERTAKWRAIVEERPEVRRLGRYASLLSDDVLARAFARAEEEGARYFVGEETGHEDPTTAL